MTLRFTYCCDCPYEAAMSPWSEFEAVREGRACFIPTAPDTEPDSDAFLLAMREADRMAERLRAERGA